MNRGHILSILYEMALTTSGETRVKPLLNKMIQRLMYHTGFTCGFFIQRNHSDETDGSTNDSAVLDVTASVCSQSLLSKLQGCTEAPGWLFEERAELIEDSTLVEQICSENRDYKFILRLPVPGKGIILLLSKTRPRDELPFTQIFEPVLNNLSNTLNLLEMNEQYLAQLQSEIEEHEKTEVELIQARADAEKANRAKSDFISSMSHELRTPMNAILGFSQLLEMDDSLSETNKDNVYEILKAGNHLLELINEVLDLSRIEAEKLEISIESVELDQLVRDCLSLVKPIADSQHIRLRNDEETLLDIAVSADHIRLKQVVINLVSNAIKYNRPSGSVTIYAEADDDSVKLCVQDTGMGIPSGQYDELFQPFNRLGAEHSDITGTGIGLVISKMLVEKMDGQIGFESKQGIGTIFWIRLNRISNAKGRVTEHHTLQLENQLNTGNSHTVLYIEDNPANLKLVEQIFSRQPNIELITAHTPILGLDLVRSRIPDMVLLDIQLPGMTGFEVLTIMRNDNTTAHIPVVALTANAMPGDIKAAKRAGFNGYLTKPIKVPELIEKVCGLISEADVKNKNNLQ